MIERTSIHRAKRDLHVLLIALLIISLVLPVGTVAAATSSATIIEIKGDVQIIRGGSEKSFAAFKDMRLTEGDKIITGPNSSAKIELENENAVLTLSENTRIYLSELKGQGDDQQTSINLQAGGIGSKVKKALSSVSRFNIKTPTATMGVRGTQFYTQYRDGDVDIRVLNGLVDVTIGASNAPVDEGAGDDPGAPPTDGTGLGVTGPDDPGTNTGAGGAAFTYTLGALQQLGFHEDDSPDQLGGLVPGAFGLGGLDETFIDDLEDQAASDPGSVPPGLLDDAEAAKEAARERALERQAREGQAPREQDENPGERGKEIARSKPSTGEDQAPDIIDQTPQSIPAGGQPGSTTTPPPAPTYDDDDGGDDYYEPTPPPASCPTGSHKVTFSVVGGNGSIFAALIENESQAVSGNCYPAGSEIGFSAHADPGYQIEEWRVNGDLVATDVPYTGQMLRDQGGIELSENLDVTVKFKLDDSSSGSGDSITLESDIETIKYVVTGAVDAWEYYTEPASIFIEFSDYLGEDIADIYCMKDNDTKYLNDITDNISLDSNGVYLDGQWLINQIQEYLLDSQKLELYISFDGHLESSYISFDLEELPFILINKDVQENIFYETAGSYYLVYQLAISKDLVSTGNPPEPDQDEILLSYQFNKVVAEPFSPTSNFVTEGELEKGRIVSVSLEVAAETSNAYYVTIDSGEWLNGDYMPVTIIIHYFKDDNFGEWAIFSIETQFKYDPK